MIQIPKFSIKPQEWIQDQLLYGNRLSQYITEELKSKLTVEKENYQQQPGLAVLLVGNDPASHIYVHKKKDKAHELGFHVDLKQLPETTTEDKILEVIHNWNQTSHIHGIIAQLPLPKAINEQVVLQNIQESKDVDGFSYANMGALLSNHTPKNIACTPLGIAVMLEHLPISARKKNAVIIGRSNIVGKPMLGLLLNHFDCTVTVCHSKSQNIRDFVSEAEILIVAIGKQNIIQEKDLRKGSIVIDVGIHRTNQGIRGDLNYHKALSKVQYITPVPKGVGPMTIAMLLYNTYNNFKRLVQ